MALIEIRKRNLTIETQYHEGGPVAGTPLRQAAACAVAGMAVHVGQGTGGAPRDRVVGTFVAMVLVHMVAKVRSLRR